MNSRLLHAAARGARIEWFSPPHDRWCLSTIINLHNPYKQRIHPDDTHLQYGPVSSALRVFAANEKEPYTLSSLLARNAYLYERTAPCDDDLHRSLFLLILSEALAEEGL